MPHIERFIQSATVGTIINYVLCTMYMICLVLSNHPFYRGAPPPGTPQRRNSDTADSLFADEDIPNKFLQADGSAQLWNNPTSPGPQTPVKIEDSTLPWEKPSTPGTRTPVETAPGEQAPDLPWEKPSGLQTPVKSALNSPLPWESKTPSGEPQVNCYVLCSKSIIFSF